MLMALSCSAACGSGNENLQSSPTVTFTVENSSKFELELRGDTWLTIDGNPGWLVWPALEGYSGGSTTCENVKSDVIPESPPEATISPGDSFSYHWKTNYYGSTEDTEPGLTGNTYCVHIARVPVGHYTVLACAQLFTVTCTKPNAVTVDDFRKSCVDLPIDIGENDISVDIPFTAEQFPTDVCAVDGSS